jgi:hypothetical protein
LNGVIGSATFRVSATRQWQGAFSDGAFFRSRTADPRFKIDRAGSLTHEAQVMGLLVAGPDLNAGNTRFLNQPKEYA